MKRLVWVLLLSLASGQEIRRPSTDGDAGNAKFGCVTGTNQASSAMPNAHDSGGLATNSVQFVIGSVTLNNLKTRIFSNWQSTSNSYTALTLNINAASLGNQGDAPTGSCIKYSIDGGVTYTTATCDGGSGYPQKTFTFMLSASQDLAKLRVGACVYAAKGNIKQDFGPGQESLVIYDIWTAGTNPAPATGNGSTSGQPHRGAVVSN